MQSGAPAAIRSEFIRRKFCLCFILLAFCKIVFTSDHIHSELGERSSAADGTVFVQEQADFAAAGDRQFGELEKARSE